MTIFQHRRFQFFDMEKVDLDISIKENLKDAQLTCGTSGRGKLLVGDSLGCIHSISRRLDAKVIANAHAKGVLMMMQLKQSPFLITMGEDDLAAYTIKVWDIGPLEYDSNKNSLILKRTFPIQRIKTPTCFSVHENLLMLAVGYSDGHIQLFRGEITRERNIKSKTLLYEMNQGEITGLSFRSINAIVYLFAACKNKVFVFDVTSKDKDCKILSDEPGCDMNCSCLADAAAGSEEHFVVARNDAIYCYNHKKKGSSYRFDGQKYLLTCFREHVLIMARTSPQSFAVTIFDSSSKFIAFSSSLRSCEPITVAVCEWGQLFLLASDGNLWQLTEKDLQSKMDVFYAKNHYDLAIKVAKYNEMGADGMAEIFRHYGDHLYKKGDLDGAIRQYCKTVGKLESSYVVRKYLDASRILNLVSYLEVIHQAGYSTPDLTTLLLNCLTKLKLNNKLEHYVNDPAYDILDPSTAIKLFRKGGMHRQAFQLAKKHKQYGAALQILLEDVQECEKDELYDILENIVHQNDAETVLRRHTVDLINVVCKEGKNGARNEDSKKIVRLLCQCPVKRELVELFIARKDILIPLLEDICEDFETNDGPMMNLLLEAYLEIWSIDKTTEVAFREKIIALMSKAPNCSTWDWARALFSCKMFGFSPGEIIAYENLGFYYDLFSFRYKEAIKAQSLWPDFISTVRKYSLKKITLWKDAFLLVTSMDDKETKEEISSCPHYIIEEILKKLIEEKLMEPLPILDRLSNTNLTLGSLRAFLETVLNRESMNKDEEAIENMQVDTDKVRTQIYAIKSKPSVFQAFRCSICLKKLDMPSVHFLCLHSFHQHCFDSFAANEKDCTVCWEENMKVLGLESNDTKPSQAAIDTDFSMKLNSSKCDAFDVLAEFFSKGLFTEPKESKTSELGTKKNIEKIRGDHWINSKPFEADHIITEARLRLHEGTVGGSSRKPVNNTTSIESYLDSQSRYAAQRSLVRQKGYTIEPKKQSTSPRVPSGSTNEASTSSRMPKTIEQAMKPKPTNPFEDDADESNPFLNEEKKPCSKSKNPFEEDDDYDSSLNPFLE